MDNNSGSNQQGVSREPRPFIGMKFTCCSVYCRIYKNRKGDAYEGMCPKCLKRVKLAIGSGGTSQRFFEAK
ncbi:MAG: hypothetical protein FWE57_02735 [Chitinispirillia bacterium]|nr:hypothetical protein [Chitinispirillia bacterium]